MKIVLQDAKSSLYMVEPGNWTPRWQEAMNFPNSEWAIQFIRSGRLADIQIVLKFPGETHDVVLAVPQSGPIQRKARVTRADHWNTWTEIPVPAH